MMLFSLLRSSMMEATAPAQGSSAAEGGDAAAPTEHSDAADTKGSLPGAPESFLKITSMPRANGGDVVTIMHNDTFDQMCDQAWDIGRPFGQ